MSTSGAKLADRIWAIAVIIVLSCAVLTSYTVFFEKPHGILEGVEKDSADGAKALIALSPDEVQRKIKLQRQYLELAPLDSLGLSNLSILNALTGNKVESDKFAQAASELSLRNPYGQYYVIQSRLNSKDYVTAYYHLDAVLTAHPDIASAYFPLAMSFGSAEVGYAALANVLDRNPTWRRSFFEWLSKHDPAGEATFNIFNAITTSGGQVSHDELRQYLSTQLDLNHVEHAYFVWLNSLKIEELAKVENVYDGSFNVASHNLSFDWNINPFPNANISIAPRSNSPANMALHLSFYNSTALFENVSQILRLPAGPFTFNGGVAAHGYKSPGGLAWVITCRGSNKVVGKSAAFTQSVEWQQFSFDLIIPEEECEAQQLLLVSASKAMLDNTIIGEIEFSDLSINARVAANGG